MASNRTNSIDSGLLSSEVQPIRDETQLKTAFPSSESEPRMSRSKTLPTNQRPRSVDSSTNRRSFHETGHAKAETSDSDPGIVPDVTKLLCGNKHRRHKATSPTYSIHINTLYVYQNPPKPVENPMYQQLPVERSDESPPSPCPKPGYQQVWPTSEEAKFGEQHLDSTGSRRDRPTYLDLDNFQGSDSISNQGRPEYTQFSKLQTPQGKVHHHGKGMSNVIFSAPPLAEDEEMEILIRGKGGKSRRYKLQPISEQTDESEPYIGHTTRGDKVVVDGFTLQGRDEAFSEAGSSVFQQSSSSSTTNSGSHSGAAIDTTVGDVKVTVNQTFQSSGEDVITDSNNVQQQTGSSTLNVFPNDAPPQRHISPMLKKRPISQAQSMHDPTYHNFEEDQSRNMLSTETLTSDEDLSRMSQSVPNLVYSTRMDTVYECRYQKRSVFKPKQRIPKICHLEGFYGITDDNEISFLKEVLQNKGKLGNWFITPSINQPGYINCLYVKSQREVTSFHVIENKKRKMYIDFNSKKTFPCLCKLTDFYKYNHLPSVNINLGHPLPKNAIPDRNLEADGSGTLKEQYAGVRM